MQDEQKRMHYVHKTTSPLPKNIKEGIIKKRANLAVNPLNHHEMYRYEIYNLLMIPASVPRTKFTILRISVESGTC